MNLRMIGVAALGATLTLVGPGIALAQDAPDDSAVTDMESDGDRPSDRRGDRADRSDRDRPDDFDEAQRLLIAAIDRRLDHIVHLERVVAGAEHLTPAHAGQLTGDLNRAQGVLTGLEGQAEAATTLEQLRSIASEVKAQGVYMVLTAKVHIVIGADTVGAGVERFGPVSEKLAEAIARAEAAGHDVTAAQRHFDAMVEHVDAAGHAVAGVADEVLAVSGDGARAVLQEGRRAVREGHAQLKQAHDEAQAVVAALRAAAGDTDAAE